MIFRHIEEKAENVLKNRGFFEIGFNIEDLAASLNIQITRKVFDENISGLLLIQGDGAIISCHAHEDTKRQRFTIAHEIGHFILHAKNQPLFVDKLQKVMYRNNASTTGEILVEREANAFAAALLMPSELLDEAIKHKPDNERDDVKYLSNLFKVSEQAMSFRLSNLGYYLSS